MNTGGSSLNSVTIFDSNGLEFVMNVVAFGGASGDLAGVQVRLMFFFILLFFFFIFYLFFIYFFYFLFILILLIN